MNETNQEVQTQRNCEHACILCEAKEKVRKEVLEEMQRAFATATNGNNATNGNGHTNGANGHAQSITVRAPVFNKVGRPSKKKNGFRTTPEFREKVLLLNKQGVDRTTIAAKMGTSWKTVNNIIGKLP